MKLADVFPGFFYWARLPGFVAFCAVATGICAARFALAQYPQFTPASAMFVNLFFAAAIIFCALAILFRKTFLRALFFFVCGAAIFCAAELNIRDTERQMELVCERAQILTLDVRITSPVINHDRAGGRFRGRVIDAQASDARAVLKNKTLQFTSRAELPPYGLVTVQGRYSAPRVAAGPLGYDQRAHFAANNISGNFIVTNILNDARAQNYSQAKLSADNISYRLRASVHDVINRANNSDVRAIFHAAFLGEREHLTGELLGAFRKAGIIHLLAISGFHAALFFGAIFAVLGIFAMPKIPRTLVSLAALWAYLFFIGFIPSLFRATIMVTFFCVSQMLQRKNHAVHSLGIAAVIWLFMSPHGLFAPGFQLSFAATAGIIMLPPALNSITNALTNATNNTSINFLVSKILSPLWISVAGFAATLVPLLHHFGTASLYGIFFNLIAIPLMSAAMWLFFIAVVLSPINFLSTLVILCAEKILSALIFMSQFSENIAYSEFLIPRPNVFMFIVIIVFMTGLCVISKNWRKVYALRAGALTAVAVAAMTVHSHMFIKTENFNFAQNSATANVIIHADNSAWIVAHGRASDVRRLRTSSIEPFLRRKKIRAVPLFIVNEEAEEEAHLFSFVNDFSPRIIVLRSGDEHGRNRRRGNDSGYTHLDSRAIVSANGLCTLRINSNAKVDVIISQER